MADSEAHESPTPRTQQAAVVVDASNSAYGATADGDEARVGGSVAGDVTAAADARPPIGASGDGGARTAASGGDAADGDARAVASVAIRTPLWLQETPEELQATLGPLGGELIAAVRRVAEASAVPAVVPSPDADSGAGLGPGSHASAAAHRVRRKHGILMALDRLVTVSKQVQLRMNGGGTMSSPDSSDSAGTGTGAGSDEAGGSGGSDSPAADGDTSDGSDDSTRVLVKIAELASRTFALLRPLVLDPTDSTIRGFALRACRYLVHSVDNKDGAADGDGAESGPTSTAAAADDTAPPFESLSDAMIVAMVGARAHLGVVRTLARSQAFLWERLQALKLVQRMIEAAPASLPLPVVRAVVAVAGVSGDNCRGLALALLRAAVVSHPSAVQVVACTGGVDVLFDAVLDPACKDQSSAILLSLLHVMNSPRTRKFVRPRLAVQRLLAPFSSEHGLHANVEEAGNQESAKTDDDGLTEGLMASWTAARVAVVTVCRTWVGLALLGSDPHGLPALVALLFQPLHARLLHVLLDTIGQMLHPPTHWQAPGADAHVPSAGSDAEAGAGVPLKARRGLAVDGATVGSHAFARSGPLGLSSQLPRDTSRDMTQDWAAGPGASSTSRRRARGRAAHAAALHARALRLLHGEVSDPPWAAAMAGNGPAARGRGISSATGDTDGQSQRGGNSGASGRVSVFGLVEGYLAVVLQLLLDAGLIQGLTVLCTNMDKGVAQTATMLLQDVIALAGRLLPQQLVARKMGMPVLVQLAALGVGDGGAMLRKPDTHAHVVTTNEATADFRAALSVPRSAGGAGSVPGFKPGGPVRVLPSGKVLMGRFPGAVAGFGTAAATTNVRNATYDGMAALARGRRRTGSASTAAAGGHWWSGLLDGSHDSKGVETGASLLSHGGVVDWSACISCSTRPVHGLGMVVEGGMVVGQQATAAAAAVLDSSEAIPYGATADGGDGDGSSDAGGAGGASRTVAGQRGSRGSSNGVHRAPAPVPIAGVPVVGLLGDMPGRSARASVVIRRLAHASLNAMDDSTQADGSPTAARNGATPSSPAAGVGAGAGLGKKRGVRRSLGGGLPRASLLLSGTEHFLPLAADHDAGSGSSSSDDTDYDSERSDDDESDRDGMSSPMRDTGSEGFPSPSLGGQSPPGRRRVSFADDSELGSDAGDDAGAGDGASGTAPPDLGIELATRSATAGVSRPSIPRPAWSDRRDDNSRTSSPMAMTRSRRAMTAASDRPTSVRSAVSDSSRAAMSPAPGERRRGMSTVLLGVMGMTSDGSDAGTSDDDDEGIRRSRTFAGGRTAGSRRHTSSGGATPTRRRSKSGGTTLRKGNSVGGQTTAASSASTAVTVVTRAGLGSHIHALRAMEGSGMVVPPGVHVAGSGLAHAAPATLTASLAHGGVGGSGGVSGDASGGVGASSAATGLSNVIGGTLGKLARVSKHGIGLSSGSATSGSRSIGAEIRLVRAATTAATAFTDALRRSNVLTTKDWRVWDWEVIASLLDGPLATSSVYFAEAMRSKFFKRLCGFFRTELGPKGGFTHLPWMPAALRYLRVARQTVLLLLHRAEGRVFLTLDRRGSFVADIIAQLHATVVAGSDRGTAGSSDGARLLSKPMFERSMSREYVALLGVLTSCTAGRAYLCHLVDWRVSGLAGLDIGAPSTGAGTSTATASTSTAGGSSATTASTAVASIASEVQGAISRLRSASSAVKPRTPGGSNSGAAGATSGGNSSAASRSSAVVLAGASSGVSSGRSRVGARTAGAAGGGGRLDDGRTEEGGGDVVARMVPHAVTGADLLASLEKLGHSSARMYLCRQLLVCLDYAGRPGDGEAIPEASRHLLRQWMLSPQVPARLRLYTTAFMRALLRRGVPGFSEWGIDLLVDQLAEDSLSSPSPSTTGIERRNAALAVLVEAADHTVYLRAIVRNLAARFEELLGPDSRLFVDGSWVDARLLHSLLLRLAADSGGVGLLQRATLLLPLFKGWKAKGNQEYAVMVDRALLTGMSAPVPHTGPPSLRPAATPGSDPALEPAATPLSVHLPAGPGGGSLEQAGWSLTALLRLPWRIEVWVAYPDEETGGGRASGRIDEEGEDAGDGSSTRARQRRPSRPTEQIPLDTYVDLSHYRPEAGGVPDIRVAAVAVTRTGAPRAYSVPPGASLRAALFVGSCAVACRATDAGLVGDIPYGVWEHATAAPASPTSSAASARAGAAGDAGDASASAGATAASARGACGSAADTAPATSAARRGQSSMSPSLRWVADVGVLGTGGSSGDASAADLCADVESAMRGTGRSDPAAMATLNGKGLVAAPDLADETDPTLGEAATWFTLDTNGIAGATPGGDANSRGIGARGSDSSAAAGRLSLASIGGMPDDAGRSARTNAGPQFSSFSGAPTAGAGGGVPAVDTGLGGGAALGEGGRAASVRVREKSVRSTGDSDARVVVQAGEPVSWMFTTSLMFSGSVRLEHLHFSLAPQPYRPSCAPLPRHLFGEAVRCSDACAVLQDGGYVRDMARDAFDESAPLMRRRAALWALGHVASRDRGVELLHTVSSDIVPDLCSLARACPVLSLRGTAIHALGLAASCPLGRAVLRAVGWGCADSCEAPVAVPFQTPGDDPYDESGSGLVSNLRRPAGIDKDPLFAGCDVMRTRSTSCPRRGACAASPASAASLARPVDLVDVTLTTSAAAAEFQALAAAIGKLANAISVSDGRAELSALRTSEPELFTSPAALQHVHGLLAQYRFPAHQRRAVLRYFDNVRLTAPDTPTASDGGSGSVPTTAKPATAQLRVAW